MSKLELDSAQEMDLRADIAQEFFDAVLDVDERPYFVSDRASLYDIFAGDESDVVRRCLMHYGVKLQREHFRIPIWQLLDYVTQNRRIRP